MTDLKLQQCRLDGRYDILSCLGRGSYAEIYVAHDAASAEGDADTVVIKALNVFLQGEPDAELERTLVENFQNEAIALDRVRHTNIINRLGHGTAIDLSNCTFHYIVMEYMSGGDMAALCKKRPLSLNETLFYLEQVCAGLAFAHSKGVIHRDIKPQNLLLSADKNIVKIADFGVAKIEATEGAITRVGTNVYAPPEHNPLVHTGPLDPSAINLAMPGLTPAADIYSLAKTTYTLLVGEAPRKYSHRQIQELPERLASEPWASSVLRTLRYATQDSPSSRYQTVEEFWDDLRDAALPPTRHLASNNRGRLPTDAVKPAAVTGEPPPPRPRFESRQTSNLADRRPAGRPRIVVAVQPQEQGRNTVARPDHHGADEAVKKPKAEIGRPYRRKPLQPPLSAGMRVVVIAILIACFSGMLLATYHYVSNRRSTGAAGQAAAQTDAVVGSEARTLTDVNLRMDASLTGQVVGMAERGSRVRILSVKNNSYEVIILEHGRPKDDPSSQDQGWINKRYVKFSE